MANDMIPQKWINTPFAYTKFSHDLTLLQQDVLIRVAEHLQRYVQVYYGSKLKDSKDVPRPLFSEADKRKGIQEIVVDFAELGVAPSNYPKLRESIDEILNLKVEHEGVDEMGRPTIIRTNIFSQSEVQQKDNTSSARFSLNIDMVDWVFDMSQGYVTHPEDIARISSYERMPMMYYLLRHESQNWKDKFVRLTLSHIKEYLHLIEYDEKTREMTKNAYPKYSKFRERVLDPSIDNINDLHARGLIDVSVTYEPVYPGTRKTGNPSYLLFKIDTTASDGKVQSARGDVASPTIIFPDDDTKQASAPRRRGRPKKVQTIEILKNPADGVGEEPQPQEKSPALNPGDRVGDWQQLVNEYGEGPSAELLRMAVCKGTIDGAFSLVMPDYGSKELMVNAASTDERLKALLVKAVGRTFKVVQVGNA